MQQQPTQKLNKKQNILQMIKFGVFSISAGVIEIASFTFLDKVAKLRYWPAYLTALVLSVLYNFTLNRRFTFKAANNVPIAMLKVAAYYCVFTPVSTIAGDAFVELGINEYIVLFCTMVSNLITEYLFCRFVVYRNAINTLDSKRKREAAEGD